jgi:hypothetical protein
MAISAPPAQAATARAAATARTRDSRRTGLDRALLLLLRSTPTGAAEDIIPGNADIINLDIVVAIIIDNQTKAECLGDGVRAAPDDCGWS